MVGGRGGEHDDDPVEDVRDDQSVWAKLHGDSGTGSGVCLGLRRRRRCEVGVRCHLNRNTQGPARCCSG